MKIFVILSLFCYSLAHTVLLPPHGIECFFEDLRRNDELSISFQVGDRNPQSTEQLTADFLITSPSGTVIRNTKSTSHGTESVVANENGKYKYCFSNKDSPITTKDVTFNVHGVVYVDVNDPRSESVDVSVRKFQELVHDVKNEQGYQVVRERTHRNTAESTNSRVKWWSVFQLIIIASNSLFQIYYLKRFFEVKTVV
ncbi:BA75_02525T0 [Komagataella pastoris]|uniref:BA75_02525T0 n=1 Tax=Komagataella pastoris TaxID=4922 RepID=A0A1B2JAU7_PICPA|nr:BA75_02525T0 [Komagataella pastoris]